MVTRDGLVGIRHHNSNPAVFEVAGRGYSWSPKYQVSLGWVAEVDVPAVLAVKVAGCCGLDKHKFSLANDFDVSIWETGHLP